jgi:hypothetical protein
VQWEFEDAPRVHAAYREVYRERSGWDQPPTPAWAGDDSFARPKSGWLSLHGAILSEVRRFRSTSELLTTAIATEVTGRQRISIARGGLLRPPVI